MGAIVPFDLRPMKLPPVLAYSVGCEVAPRRSVEALIQKAIDALDDLDPDPDLEENDTEDAFALSWIAAAADGPGCRFSECGEDDDPGGTDLDHGEGTDGVDC